MRKKSKHKHHSSTPHMRTSIGMSPHSRPKNKHKRRLTKPYRGQGK